MKIAWGIPLLLAVSCSEKPQPKAVPSKPLAEQDTAAASAPPTSYVEDDDPTWLRGMWKEDGKESWLLFNPNLEVVELGGKPAHGLRKGKLNVHGKYIGILFETEALMLEASPDKSELATSDIRRVYRRGAPP